MDTYSNILYVGDKKEDLSFLAHEAVSMDKYRPETCCIIGASLSLSEVVCDVRARCLLCWVCAECCLAPRESCAYELCRQLLLAPRGASARGSVFQESAEIGSALPLGVDADGPRGTDAASAGISHVLDGFVHDLTNSNSSCK